jgi:hypothetical protein
MRVWLLQGTTKHKRWFLDALAEVHHTRFLLQPAALEVFVHDRSNALLSFPSHKACAPILKLEAHRLHGCDMFGSS